MAKKTDTTVDDPDLLEDGGQFIPEYRPPDYEVIGADGGLFGGGLGTPTGNLADVLRTDIQYAPGYYPGQGIVVSADDADRLGLGGNIFLSNPNFAGTTIPISTVSTGPAAPAATTTTPPVSTVKGAPTMPEDTPFGKIYNEELARRNAVRAANGQSPISATDVAEITQLADWAVKEQDKLFSDQDSDAQRQARAKAAVSAKQTGIPLVIPIPGMDPTTAMILTAAGFILSGGNVARFDPNNPVQSIIDAGKGTVATVQKAGEVLTGQTDIGNIFGGGTGTSGSTGAGSTVGGTQTPIGGAVIIGAGGASGGGSTNVAGTGGSSVGAGQTTPGTVGVTPGAVGGSVGGTQTPQTGTPSIIGSGVKGGNVDIIDDESYKVGPGLKDVSTGGTTNDNLPKPQDETPEIKPVDNTQKPDDTITCPAPETPILLADGTQIPAGELQAGMVVRTAHETTCEWGNYAVTRVSIVKDKRLRLVLNDGAFICSPTHKFSTGNGWKQANEYRAGDALQHRTVVAVHDYGDGDVVSITVDGAHTYVSDGLLSHNKTPIIPPVDQPPSTKCEPGYEKDASGNCVPITPPPPPPPPPPSTSTPIFTTVPTFTLNKTTPNEVAMRDFEKEFGLTSSTLMGQAGQDLAKYYQQLQSQFTPSSLTQLAGTSQQQLQTDFDRYQAAMQGQLSPEDIRAAQQGAREAYAARGQVFSPGAVGAEILGRDQLMRQRQAEARANLQQSLGNVGAAAQLQTGNIFAPFANLLAKTYSPTSEYANAVYDYNVNAYNAYQAAQENLAAYKEAAAKGQQAEFISTFAQFLSKNGIQTTWNALEKIYEKLTGTGSGTPAKPGT